MNNEAMNMISRYCDLFNEKLLTKADKMCLPDAVYTVIPACLNSLVWDFLTEVVPKYFWTIPASSSGKYHPSISLGDGGLVRHTTLAAEVIIELARLEKYADANPKIAMCAILMHDTFKNGHLDTGHTVMSHPRIAADEWQAFAIKRFDGIRLYFQASYDGARSNIVSVGSLNKFYECRTCRILTAAEIEKLIDMLGSIIKNISDVMASHMGQWYIAEKLGLSLLTDKATIDMVQMADYISSRKFFDLMTELK